MIEHLLHEPLDRLAGLDAQFLGHAGLLQTGFVHQFRQRRDAGGRAEREHQPVRVGDIPASLPAGVDGDDDLRVRPGRVRD